MQTRAMGPGAAWSWLKQAINLGRNNPKPIFGAIALLALIALIPSVIQLCLQYGFKLGPQSVLTVIGLTTLVSIVIYPLLIGGVLRVIDASEHGRPTHATAIFDTFRSGQGAGRLIGFGVVVTLVYIAVFVAVIALFGKDFLNWYMQVITTSMQAQPMSPASVPTIPEGFGRVLGLGSLFGLFLGGVYAIGFGQVALAGKGVAGSLADGVAGTLKNLLPILLLAVTAVVLLIVLGIVVAIVGGLLAVIGGLVHPALAVILVLPVYLGMLLVLYVVMFGVMYYMWRDICGQAAAPANQVAL